MTGTGDGRGETVVCGTGFGRVYLAALRDHPDLRLAGVLARGSARSAECARAAGVPLYTSVDDLPASVRFACVAVYAGVNGGPGSELARALLRRGVHVIQEGPLHHDELAATLGAAREGGAAYRVSTHYDRVAPVRRFLDGVRALRSLQPLRYVEVVCGLQVLYHALDVVGAAVGRWRPWSFTAATGADATGAGGPFRTVEGAVGGVPVTLRVQNQLNPADPDNHAHVLLRVTAGADGGHLLLANAHGPVLWSPRPHFPRSGRELADYGDAEAAHLDLPSVQPWGPASAPGYREILTGLWPRAAALGLAELSRAADAAEDALRRGQYHLTLSRVWQEASAPLGRPEPLHEPEPVPLSLEELRARVPSEAEEEHRRVRT
ncbi:Gfo/Idh/MocA family oxidoreductase [Nocardiopsis dassonvillei]|uniref:Gfo/Idh/MocA family oxidoreductase n=1 Tax=Nocardiopsis dassonvillei TaxID=2014 RepID=UPI003702A4BA